MQCKSPFNRTSEILFTYFLTYLRSCLCWQVLHGCSTAWLTSTSARLTAVSWSPDVIWSTTSCVSSVVHGSAGGMSLLSTDRSATRRERSSLNVPPSERSRTLLTHRSCRALTDRCGIRRTVIMSNICTASLCVSGTVLTPLNWIRSRHWQDETYYILYR